jgi:hypothetical protein
MAAQLSGTLSSFFCSHVCVMCVVCVFAFVSTRYNEMYFKVKMYSVLCVLYMCWVCVVCVMGESWV